MTAPSVYLRASSMAQAQTWLAQHPQARLLAGGQSLLATLRMGLGAASHLIDLQDLQELRQIEHVDGGLLLGALCTHANVARSALVLAVQPWLSHMAGHIADPQVREMGTLGGSLANADPAACWPAAVLAAGAVIHTTHRQIPADGFFKGLFATALQAGEIVVGVFFPQVSQAAYQKIEHAASRFAHPGVAVVRQPNGQVRVAVTGLGQGVVRWSYAEQALSQNFSAAALTTISLSPTVAEDDLHATARYKTHLAHVLCRRIVAGLTGEAYVRLAGPAMVEHQAEPLASTVDPDGGLSGERVIAATPMNLWHLVLDPQVLQRCLPGCEAIHRRGDARYEAVVLVGIGLVSARFSTTVDLTPIQVPTDTQGGQMRLTVAGSAGPMGRGSAEATFSLVLLSDGSTKLRWHARPVLEGKLAQIGQRFVFAAARQLSESFLDRLQSEATGQTLDRPYLGWLRRSMRWIQSLFSKFKPRRF